MTVTTDLLKRREVSGEYEYSAGKRLLAKIAADENRAMDTRFAGGYQPKAITGKIKQPPKNPSAKTHTNKPAGHTVFPEPLTVPIEDDVPNTSNRGGKRVCWLPLLGRLTKAGQSAALPVRCKATLSKSITQAHKQWDARFTTKVDAKAGTVRVWRVA